MGTSIVSGNFKTRAGRILVMGDQKKGKPVDPQKLGKHQSRLSTLGIFDAISVKTVDVPGSDPPEKTCLIRVTERQTGFVEYGLDINTDRGIEVAGAIGERNLFGRAVSGSLSVLAGTERFNVTTSLSQPTLFGMHVFNGLKASYTKDGTYTGFALETQALELGFNRDFTPKKRLSLVYRIERQTPVSIEAGYEDAAGLEQVRIGSVTPTLSLDNRDDQFMTTRGDYILATVKVSRQAFGGDTDFDRYEIQRNWYKTYGGTFTVATALRFGYARIGDDQELPIGERFFLGGANSHRGFREKELGPVAEDGSLIGGTSYALGNAELRFPLLGPLAGGLFVDAGNAFLDGIEVSDLRWAVGTGLRLGTPIGPLRVDVGFNLGRKENESSYIVHFAIGHAF
jgi:outer membrane protein insertion porin family